MSRARRSSTPTARRHFEAWLLETHCTVIAASAQMESMARGLSILGDRQEEVRGILRTHKAFPQFQHNTVLLAQNGPRDHRGIASEAMRWFGKEVAECRTHLDLLREELRWISGRPEIAGTGLAVIKGFNNARFYVDPAPRWSRDLDLYVPHWDAACALLEILRERGYGFDENECPWFKAEPERGRAEYGQIFLVRRRGDLYSRVDIHFGTYSAGFGEYIKPPLTNFYEPAGPDLSYQALNPTGSLLVMFAHALSDGYVAVKDINDAASIALTRSDIDFDLLSEELHRHALRPQARVLAGLLARYRNERIAEFAAELRRIGGPRRPSLWRAHDRNWQRRAAVNAGHAFRGALRSRRGLLDALRRAVQCAVFYNRRLAVRVGNRSLVERVLLQLMARADLEHWRLCPDACPTAIHTGHAALADIPPSPPRGGDAGSRMLGSLRPTATKGVTIGPADLGGQLMTIGKDVFLCSWDQVVAKERVALAKRVAAERASDGDTTTSAGTRADV
ncbi:nucleotidyltransferase family protein [Actinomadura luteofluorescens]|uniref:nucleotidyltransferase family protein n=1 Tax=Actinomadura luteofluorescens TaxID=46163 RepID=UPI0030CBC5D4